MNDWLPATDPAASRTFTRDIFADYFQFFLEDAEVGSLPEEELTEYGKTLAAKLVYARKGSVVVGTVRNMTVGVSIEIHGREPQFDLEPWDHVTEAALEVSSGKVALLGCTDYRPEAFTFPLPNGDYRVRILCGGFTTLSDDGLDGEDHYRLQIWPAPPAPVVILKASDIRGG